jgi:hypothetical protein
VNSYVISPEVGPVGTKHVEIRRYKNEIEREQSLRQATTYRAGDQDGTEIEPMVV